MGWGAAGEKLCNASVLVFLFHVAWRALLLLRGV